MTIGSDPLISVIIPTYNCASYIPDAIDSALCQTYKNIEIIVVDDGSTDNTAAVLKKYGKKITVHSQENRGLSAARNTGFKISKGQFICFLDSDDILLPEKFSLQMEAFEKNPDVDVFISGYIDVDEDGVKEILSGKKRWNRDGLEKMLKHEVFPPHAALIKRTALEKSKLFPENIITGESQEDWELWLDMALDGAVFSSVDEITCKYRRRKGSISANPLKHLDGARRVVRFLKNHPRAVELKDQIDELEAMIEMERVAAALRIGDVKLAEKELVPAVTRYREYWENPEWYHRYFKRRISLHETNSWLKKPDMNLYEKILIKELLPMMKNAFPDRISRRLEGAIYLSFTDMAYNLKEPGDRMSLGLKSLFLSPGLCIGKKGNRQFLRAMIGPVIGGMIGRITRAG